jgi:tetratricopeptide (TPR) repeat protein
MTKQALHLIETGQNRPTREHLLAIATRLGVPVERLQADPRDPRERELEQLADARQLEKLEHVARRVVDDKTAAARTHAIARYYLGRALVDREPREAVGEFRIARARLARLGISELAAEALEWQAMALHYLQDPSAVELGRRALAQYRSLAERSPAVESRMLEHLGTFLLQRREYDEAVACYHQAVATAGSVLDLARLANIYHGLAASCDQAGRQEQSLDYMERAISFYRSAGEVRGAITVQLARAENDYGHQLMKAGRLERAEEMIQASLRHYAELQVETGKTLPLLSMGELRHRQGRGEEAVDWTCQAIELAERLGAPVSIAEGYQQLGELSLRGDDWERFEAAFTRALEVLDAANLPGQAAEALARYKRLLHESVPASSPFGMRRHETA